jgi:hypothetical protein
MILARIQISESVKLSALVFEVLALVEAIVLMLKCTKILALLQNRSRLKISNDNNFEPLILQSKLHNLICLKIQNLLLRKL